MYLARSLRPRHARRTAVAVGAALVVSTAGVLAPPAGAATRLEVLHSAAAYARQQGYDVGIAVVDTKTGVFRGAGDYRGTFASESLIKVFIATRLLLAGRMYGSTEARAWKMITQSDDAIASSLYGSVGGDGLVSWMAQHYHVSHLGYAPSRPGWWGNTHLHPDGLVHLYAKLKADRRVGPWLLNAMHHATRYGSDGFYQYFGIPSATTNAAIKQGWGNDYEIGSNADQNSTGFVNGDRYAMVILARGPSYTYGSQIGGLLTGVARRLMPNGQFPDPYPVVTGLSSHAGATTGGNAVTIYGRDFTHVTGVRFGWHYRSGNVRVISPTKIIAVAPRHWRVLTNVRVFTTHGTSPVTGADRYQYEWPPALTSLSSLMGRSAGGGTIVLRGGAFTQVRSVLFGSTPARFTVLSRRALQVTVPQHARGLVPVRVTTPYGTTPATNATTYRYVNPPTLTSISPDSGPDGTTITLRGTGYWGATKVWLDGVRAPSVTLSDGLSLTAVVPDHIPGKVDVKVDVTVTTPYGTATTPYGTATLKQAFTYVQ